MKYVLGFTLLFFAVSCQAQTCPNPKSGPLSWGEVPPGWRLAPYSNSPQADPGTVFKSAKILVVFRYGEGVVCSYQNTVGGYAIWQQAMTRKPSPWDNYWIERPYGYICTEDIEICQFYTAKEYAG